MRERAPEHQLRTLLAGDHRAHRLRLATRVALRAAAIAAVVVGLAVAVGVVFAGGEGAAWTRLVFTLLLCAGAIVAAVRGYLRRATAFDGHLEQIERRFPEVRSWLRNALDFDLRPDAHASSELQHAVVAEAAARARRLPLVGLRPRLGARTPLLSMGASLLAIVVMTLVAPQAVTRSWTTLWRPALAAPPLRLEVEPGSVKIAPGVSLAVRARVWGGRQRPVLHRAGGARVAATSEGGGRGGSRVWRFDLVQLTRDQDYWVRIGNVESPHYRIALAGEPVPVSFEVAYRAPAYARLPDQRGTATRGDLAALRGTRAQVEVTFDRDLESLEATLPDGLSSKWRPLTARRWKGEVPIEREGEYVLRADAPAGTGRYRYRITPLEDAPPVIVVHAPGGDVDLPAGQQIPVAVSAHDDLGLSELRLQFRKDPTADWTNVPLAAFKAHPREASVETRWDASNLGLLPGQTAAFRFELFDDNAVSGRGRAVSPTFELRFPSLAELYDKIDEHQGRVQNNLEDVTQQVRELQKSLDKLARQPNIAQNRSNPSFERSEELKSAVERQTDLNQRIEQAARELRQSLDHAAERQAFDDQLMRKLQEMSDLMNQVQSPEFQEALRKMREALEKLDHASLERQLPQWRQSNEEMLQNLQRSIELLKQLRQEEQIASLARRAEELQKHQDALNREHQSEPKAKDPSEQEAQNKALAELQEQAAKQSEALAKEAQQLSAEMQKEQNQEPSAEKLEKAAEKLSQEAAPKQHDASEQSMAGENQKANQSGEQASKSLGEAAQMLGQMADAMSAARQSVDLAAVRRAAQDLLALQRESEANLSANRPLEQRADLQTDLSDGVARVADSLALLSERTPFISPKLSQALGRAIDNLSSSGREMGGGNRMRGEQTGRAGSQALNMAVLELRDTENSMCQSPSMGGNKPGNMAQQMGQLGERQGQLNQETRSLSERLSQQMRLTAGDKSQLERLAQEQARIREQLEQIQKEDEVRRELLGRLDGARSDMQEVEEALKNGATGGDLEQRQSRILSRLLDAQRSVNRRDFDPQRESRPGEDLVAPSAPPITDDLLRQTDRLRLDLLKAEADRYPPHYRAFIEAYIRALNGSPR